MQRSLSPLLLLLTACNWTPPEREATSGMSGIFLTDGSDESTGWLPERGPPVVNPAPGPGSTSGAEASGSSLDPGETGASPGVTVDLAALRISEVLADPTGKDGGATSPEFVEILHVGDQPTPLAGLEIVTRSWPVQSAADLGIADEVLAPGQRLLVLRYAMAGDLPAPLVIEEGGITVAFAHDDGLRNADGGVLLRAGGVAGDLMIYGAEQAAPFAGPWIGPPVPAPDGGVSLCRVAEEDHDDASDFAACAPSPGEADEDSSGGTTGPGTSSGESTSGTTSGEVMGSTGMAPALPAEVVIVEVLSNPVGPGNGEKFAEFVELVNLGPGDVDLAGWWIADSVDDDPSGDDPIVYASGDGGCAPSTCLAAGERAIVVGDVYTGPTGPGLVLMTDDSSLANGGLAVHEPVVVRDGDGVVRSTYRAWPDPAAAPDPAMTEEALVREPGADDVPEVWSFAAPSPGT